jgi:CDP-diacylglycerol--serine O-phosphatidyltransferase
MMAHTVKTWYQRTKKGCKRSASLLTFLCTYANALCGFIAIIAAIQNRYVEAFIALCIAGLMDFCDGKLARYLGTNSILGAELDTLCDAISFCLAPTIITLRLFQSEFGLWGICALSFYLCAGLFRLARYNCQQAGQVHSYFQGMSAPMAGIFLVLFGVNYALHFAPSTISYAGLLSFIVALGFLMSSCIPFPSGKKRKPLSQEECVIMLCALITAGTVLYVYPYLLLCIPFIVYVSYALLQFGWQQAKVYLNLVFSRE